MRRSCRVSCVAAIFLLAVAAGTMCSSAKAQTDAWAWIAGSSTLGGTGAQPGVYGTLGQPAPGNLPGGRNQAVTWTDHKGNLWLFGGYGTDTTGEWRFLNDLWEFNPSSNEWTWISGSSTVTGFWGQAGVYGTLGQPGTANAPGGRFGATGWADSNGNLWLFGGWGCESGAINGFPDTCYYNDLWEFNPTAGTWSWMGGSNTTDQSGVYGSLGKAATTNIPGSRDNAVSWTDSQGNFWLFGGYGYDSAGTLGYLNDLWEFSISANEWTWIGGSDVAGSKGVGGALAMPSGSNVPGSRSGSVGWTDAKGNLWLLGGYGVDSNGETGYLNDLWQFNPSTQDWTWVNGSNTVSGFGGQPGVYATWMTPASSNMPGGRQYATGWTDQVGNLWLFGGYGYDSAANAGYMNDLWEYNPSTNEWAWTGGNETLVERQNGELGLPGVYGSQNTPSLSNTPGGREGAVSWADSRGNLWLLGGYGFDSNGVLGFFNDVWEFAPSVAGSHAASAPSFSPDSGTYSAGQTVTLSDPTPGSTIYYFTSGSVAAAQYTAPLSISSTESVQAIAVASGYTNSAVTTATYIVQQTAAPTFSVAPGTYSTPQNLILSDVTPNAVIYYTTDGTTPTTSSTEYTGQFTVSSSETIQAVAVASGYAESSTSAASYTIWPAPALNEWAWMMGPGAGAPSQVYGTLGVLAVGNIPGGRDLAASWTDKSGNFWLFGGNGGYGGRNDLWKFTTSSSEWAWISGNVGMACTEIINFPYTCSQSEPGIYGTLGRPAAENIPGGRQDASTWVDNSGNLWLFGGYGLDANGTPGQTILNDLWKYDVATNQWTWISGSNTVSACFNDGSGNGVGAIHCAEPSTYGTLGTFAPGNTPGSREGAITWTDKNGDLWLFGGWSFDIPNQVQYYFDELWEYNTSTNQWAWMGGSSTREGSACAQNVNFWYLTCGEPGTYGTIVTPASGNIPGGRSNAASWTDRSGNLWLFSGSGFDAIGNFGDTQDLWEFNPSTKQWAWMGGNNALLRCDSAYIGGGCSGPSVEGTLGTPAAGNFPAGRDHASAWTDSSGNFWLLGGGWLGFLDTWEFSSLANEWTWMGNSGNSATLPDTVFGTLGTPGASNGPGSVYGASSWVDGTGDFWLFGGQAPFASSYVYSNNLWRYDPSAPAPVPGFALVDLNFQGFNNVESFVVAAGTSGTTTVNTVVADGFNQPVTLSAVNLPTGIIAKFSPNTITGFGVSEVTFSVALNVSPGDYTLTIAGASGTVTETTTLTLEVASAPPPNFSLSASPSTLVVNSGSQGSLSLAVSPEYGFNSTVSFACSGLPANATCSFSPTSVTPSGAAVTTQLTIAVSTQASVVRPNSRPFLPATELAVAACFIIWKRRRAWGGVLMAVLVLAGAGLLSGCGGGGGTSGGGGGTGGGGGSPQSYTVTVTATSATVIQTTTVTLTEN